MKTNDSLRHNLTALTYVKESCLLYPTKDTGKELNRARISIVGFLVLRDDMPNVWQFYHLASNVITQKR